MSGALDKSLYDGNTILLKISEEIDRHRYVNIGGNVICSFLTNESICKYISNMGKNLIPYSIAIGMENIYFLTPLFTFIRREKTVVDDDDLLKTNENSVDPYGNHISQSGKDSSKNLRTNRIHSNFDYNNKFVVYK